jgi:hypothetical protein
MKAKGAALQAGMAGLGMVLAYAAWQKEPERQPGESVIFDVTQNELQHVRYEDGPKWVELDRRKNGDETHVWLKISPKADPKSPTPEREVRGNDSAEKLFERFAPLRAVRALGKLDAAKLKEFGLESPKKKLAISARGEKRTFSIGTPPAGVTAPYMKDERDGQVYVLSSSITSDLDAASTRLVDRALHAFKATEFDGIVLTVGAKKRELIQSGGETPMAAKLASKSSPQKPDALAKNWHDKIWRLYTTDVLGKGEQPRGGAPQVAARLEYTFRGKTRGFIEIGRVTAAASAPPNSSNPPTSPTTPELYARSENTASWVKLPSSTEELLKEADKVIASE